LDGTVSDPLRLARRFANDFMNGHDLSVVPEIMSETYTLHIGGHDLSGRDEVYLPAVSSQLEEFPGLVLTVNDVICAPEGVALAFTEHGASVRLGGTRAAWRGVVLYRIAEGRLVEGWAEEDYLARRRQLADGMADPVDPPVVAPWDTAVVPADPDAEGVVRAWLSNGAVPLAELAYDDQPPGVVTSALLQDVEVTVDALVAAGRRVAFHAALRGSLCPNEVERSNAGGSNDPRELVLHVAGMVEVADQAIVKGRIVQDRLGLQRSARQVSGG
jgi:predicted ester cyclase